MAQLKEYTESLKTHLSSISKEKNELSDFLEKTRQVLFGDLSLGVGWGRRGVEGGFTKSDLEVCHFLL